VWLASFSDIAPAEIPNIFAISSLVIKAQASGTLANLK